jgi:hypothetical protein
MLRAARAHLCARKPYVHYALHALAEARQGCRAAQEILDLAGTASEASGGRGNCGVRQTEAAALPAF